MMKKTSFIISLALAVTACGAGSQGNSATSAKAVETDPFSGFPAFNADSAYQYVADQVSFGPRNPGSSGHKLCYEYLKEKLSAFNADTLILQTVPVVTFNGDQHQAKNILARYNSDAKERVLLVAHWDTRPWADEDPDHSKREKPVLGANDGASGAGVLLEISRQLKEQPLKNIGVDLLFVDVEDSGESNSLADTEETWCLGTQQWVKDMPYDASNLPRYGILLDMVGGHQAQFTREFFSNRHASDVVNKVWSIAAKSGMGSRFVNKPGGAVVDDHLFINRAGIPCIDIIENSNRETGSFNPTWHTEDDNLSAIDRRTLGDVGQVVVNTIFTENTH